MENDVTQRLDTLETQMREHQHTGIDSTSTIPSPRPNIQRITTASTITPLVENDMVDITAIGSAFTIANPSGNPYNGRKLLIRIKDDGTGRAITWGSLYVAGGYALPSTTIASKILTLGFMYNTANDLNKWQCLGGAQEA